MIANIKPYPHYKESGMPWLGQVPGHWEVLRLKSRLLRNDAGVWGTTFDERGTIVLRSTEQLVDGGWRLLNPARLVLSDSQRKAAILDVGDLVVTKSSGSALHIGKTSLVTQRIADMGCCFSNFMQRLRVSSNVSPTFAWILLNSRIGREQFVYQSTTTTGLGNLNGTILGNCTFAFPSPPEQAAIVRFLDWANGRLERAIRAKRKIIALLNEQKQAIIHRAVTRGLDLSVPLKPSGIPWLGEIPQHWEVKRLKAIAQIRYGLGQPPRETDKGLPLIRATNIDHGRILKKNLLRVDPDDVPASRNAFLKTGEIIVVRSGALTADSAIIPAEYEGAVAGYDMVVTVKRARPEFIATTLLSRYVQHDQLIIASMRAAQPHLNAEELGSAALFLPPDEEQQLIVRFVRSESVPIESASARLEREIELLREYRTRLVADVVTGKLDVREAATRLPDEAGPDTVTDDTDPSGDVETADEEAAAA